MTFNADLLYEGTPGLFREHGAKTPTEYAREAYDRTECGVWTTFITIDDEIPSSYLTPQQDTAAWAARHVVGVKHGTIVEGSDANFTCDTLLFPFTDEQLADAWQACEDFAEENFGEWDEWDDEL